MVSKLDLYYLFYTVGKNKSFSKAAKELYMSQPAISQSIAQLEKELDTRLFNRLSKGVTLTDEGNLLFEYVSSALQFIQAGEEKLLEFKNLIIGEFKIGVSDTISRYFLLPYLETFHNRYPNLKFKIVNGTTWEIIAALKAGEVNIAICNLPIDDKSLEVNPLLEIQDTFVYGEKYRKALSKPIKLEELVKFPLILLDNSNSRKYVEEFFLTKGIKIQPEFELGSHELLLEFAKINLGVACVTKEFSEQLLRKGLLHEVTLMEPIPKRSIGICYIKNVPLNRAAERFVDIIEENIRNFF
ncbi:LysR family transcriptional regulator [Siminovitchia fortis]|uniref:LysR family transcriptional regulator n=1 Tax=Siminovitchia fortis TaxID=254758 RepID=A0A443IRR0_9BACI|nr:LysR family transcriptional regulator [Siminovitchia fortis]RWR08975.1 LysR family transcriptional regulator [Siminovitchia fortis]WHY81409.1 LysR family transcriptional regulator [Siminovitchia fortis]